jgi:hypothetical protein
LLFENAVFRFFDSEEGSSSAFFCFLLDYFFSWRGALTQGRQTDRQAGKQAGRQARTRAHTQMHTLTYEQVRQPTAAHSRLQRPVSGIAQEGKMGGGRVQGGQEEEEECQQPVKHVSS